MERKKKRAIYEKPLIKGNVHGSKQGVWLCMCVCAMKLYSIIRIRIRKY